MRFLLLLLAGCGVASGEVCQAPLDVAVVLDASGSVAPSDWQLMVDFTNNIINDLHIGPSEVRMAIIQFSSYYTIISNLAEHQTNKDLISAFRNSARVSGDTNTADAIRAVRLEVFSQNPRAVAKIVILLTDGYSNDRTSTENEAVLLQNFANMHVFAIGIGAGYSTTEINVIASDPDIYYAKTLYTFNILYQVAALLGPQFCQIGLGVATGVICLKDVDCLNILNSACTLQVCTCLSQQLQYDPVSGGCKPRSGSCNTAIDCSLLQGSLCTSAFCTCPAPPCKVCKLGLACTLADVCSDAISGWECSAGWQACNSSRVQTGDFFCKIRGLGESCSSKIQCSEMNGTCLTGQCACNHAALLYDADRIQCHLRQLGQTCQNDAECGFIHDAVCRYGSCACSPPFVSTSGSICSKCLSENQIYDPQAYTCVEKMLDDPCSTDSNCWAVANSVCSGGWCACAPRYGRIVNSNRCGFCGLGTYCETNVDCTGIILNSVCNNNVLECVSGSPDAGCMEYTTIPSNSCTTQSDCWYSNQICTDDQCTCAEGYIFYTSACVKIAIGLMCSVGSDVCQRLPGAECRDGVCVCKPGYIENDGEEGCGQSLSPGAIAGQSLSPGAIAGQSLSPGAIAGTVVGVLLTAGVAGGIVAMLLVGNLTALTSSVIAMQAATAAVTSSVAATFGAGAVPMAGGAGEIMSFAPASIRVI